MKLLNNRIFTFVLILNTCLLTAQIFLPNAQIVHNSNDLDKRKFVFGLDFGFYNADYRIEPHTKNTLGFNANINTTSSFGYCLGVTVNRKLKTDHFRLGSGIYVYFSESTVQFKHLDDTDLYNTYTPIYGKYPKDINIKSTLVQVPLILYYFGDYYNNARPFVGIGAGYGFNTQSNEKKTLVSFDDIFRMTTHNFTAQFELGTELYFKYFKVAPSIKGIFFINDQNIGDGATFPNVLANSIDKLSARYWVLSFKFQ